MMNIRFLFVLVIAFASASCAAGHLQRDLSSITARGWEPSDIEASLDALEAAIRAEEATAVELALAGSLHELRGRPAFALERLARAVSLGARSDEPAEIFAAESAAAQLSNLEDRAERWPQIINALAAELADHPGSPRLTRLVQGLAVRQRAREADGPALEEAIQRAACLRRWSAVGPFGDHSLLSFDDVHGPAEPGPLREQYPLGRSRELGRPFEPVVDNCEVALEAPTIGWGGTTYAISSIDIEEATEVVLALDTTSSARVWVDDTLVLTYDRRQAYLPAVAEVRLRLDAGEHALVVGLTSRYRGPLMLLTVTDDRGRPIVSQQSPGRSSSPSAGPPQVLESPSYATEESSLARYLAAHIALELGDNERIRQLVEGGPTELSESAPGLVMMATSWAGDRTVPYDVARNRSLALLRQVVDIEPAAWRPYFEQARFDADEERYEDALRQVRQGLERAPEQPTLWLLQASLLTSRGLWSEVAASIDHAELLARESCRHREARLALARGRNRPNEIDEAATAVVACNHRSDALVRAHIDAARWDEAVTELQRLINLRGERQTLMSALAEAQRGRDDPEQEVRILMSLLDRDPEDRAALIDLVDLSVAADRTDDALRLLERMATQHPADHFLERRTRALLTDDELLDEYRVDGAEIIREFEASGASYEQPSVLVLDRTVFRVYPDGSIVELTHNITRVQSAEGIEMDGEFHLPRGASLLAIRTVKADGTILEPEDIEGKSSLSLPNLEPGDYVEVEYLRGHEPPPEFPGGVWPWRFYFQGYQRAFHHSELIVVTPTELDLDLSWRGEPVDEEPPREEGSLRIRRWVAREMGTLVAEPAGPNRAEIIPSLQVGADASWGDYRRALREAFIDRNRPSRAISERARAIIEAANATTEEARVDALFRWVAENIEESNDPLGHVSHILAARTGERTRLLAALARAIDFGQEVPVEVGFARSTYADQTDDPLPSLDMYQYPVARIGQRWYYVGQRARWAPSCFMPPDLRGQPVLMISGDEVFAHIPEESCQPDGAEVQLQLELASDGTARGRLRETLRGFDAVQWRSLLGRTPENERVGVVEERHIADVLPGAEVVDLQVQNERQLSEPLIVELEIRGIRIAEPVADGGLRLVLPFRSELVESLASLATRSTPLVIRAPIQEQVRYEVTLPEGHEATAHGADSAITPMAEMQIESSFDAGSRTINVERSLQLRTGRVPPSAYEAFAAFCRDVDRLEGQPIEIRR